MTKSKVGPLPFVFLLAIASEANGGLSEAVVSEQGQLRTGMLSGLLNAAPLPSATEPAKPAAAPAQTVQYFPNFRNCISGNWRNC